MVSFPRLCQRVIAHWRTILLVLILAPGAFYVIHPDELSLLLALLLIFIASQIFWIGRVVLAYLFVIAYSFPTTIAQGHTFRIGFYRLPVIVTEAVFWSWEDIDFGQGPTIRVNRVSMFPKGVGVIKYVVTNEQLYASRYIRIALQVLSTVRVCDNLDAWSATRKLSRNGVRGDL
jgi:hypothetical protein